MNRSDCRSASDFGVGDHCGVSGRPSAVDRERGASSVAIAARVLRRDRWLEQPLGRLDVQIVGDVEDVSDQRALDRVRAGAAGRDS